VQAVVRSPRSRRCTQKVQLSTQPFPRGTAAGHDIDYARLRLLEVLAEHPNVQATVASDYTDIESWLGAMRGLQRRFFGGG